MALVHPYVSAHMAPTAEQENAWQLWLLGTLYGCLSLLTLVEILRSVYYHGRRISFRTTFYFLIFVTMTLRCVITLKHFAKWDLFWLLFLTITFPIFLQFATFSLLVLFLLKILLVSKNKTKTIYYRLYPGYIIIQGVAFIVAIGMSALNARVWTPVVATYDQRSAIVTGTLFFALCLFALWGNYIIRKNLGDPPAGYHFTVKVFKLLGYVYFFVFLLRALWSLTYFFGFNPIQRLVSEWNSSDGASEENYFTSVLIFYTIAEVVPTTTTIVCFLFYLPSKRRSLSDPLQPGESEAVYQAAPDASEGLFAYDHFQGGGYGTYPTYRRPTMSNASDESDEFMTTQSSEYSAYRTSAMIGSHPSHTSSSYHT